MCLLTSGPGGSPSNSRQPPAASTITTSSSASLLSSKLSSLASRGSASPSSSASSAAVVVALRCRCPAVARSQASWPSSEPAAASPAAAAAAAPLRGRRPGLRHLRLAGGGYRQGDRSAGSLRQQVPRESGLTTKCNAASTPQGQQCKLAAAP